ncbi:unnamed protein product [Alopecurus aequalis]
MSQSHRGASAPALSEDDIISVFLLIPPDDPALLIRASLICKAWRRILTSPEFCRLYREFHGTPPILGVAVSCWSRDSGYASRFFSTTFFRLSADLDLYPHKWMAVDCRHGRMLLELVDDHGLTPSGYVVWDPITNGRWEIPYPGLHFRSPTGAVLCAKEHCDHLGCHGPPFLVAMVDACWGTTSASVYSSESGAWSDIITLKHQDLIRDGRSILVGNTLHFPFAHSVLQYNLGEQKLSIIHVPDKYWDASLVFISAEDGVLVFAELRGTRLSLWSTEAGALAWEQRKVIDLEKLLPPRAFEPKPHGLDECELYVSAFAEGAVFLSTMAGLFTVELSSGRTMKVAEVEMAYSVIPLISFYTPDYSRRVIPRP